MVLLGGPTLRLYFVVFLQDSSAILQKNASSSLSPHFRFKNKSLNSF
jgi:hypothetical protein